MTYREPVRCVSCLQPWSGWGIICNECRIISALRQQPSATPNTSSTLNPNEGHSSAISLPAALLIWAIFLLVDYNLNFTICKVIWLLCKVGFYLMFGWWMGISIESIF